MAKSLWIEPGLEGRLWLSQPPRGNRLSHAHLELEFNLVVRGSCRYLINGTMYDLPVGALLWLFPLQDHLMLEPSENLEVWIAVFRPAMVDRVCMASTNAILREGDPGEGFCRRLPRAATTHLHELYTGLVGSMEDLPRYNAGLAYMLLETWAAFLEAVPVTGEEEVHPAVDRAVQLIRSGRAPEGLDPLAKTVGLSPSRLSRLFKQQIGMPLTRFRNRVRLQQYFDLYGEGRRLTMLEAALDAGFGSYAQFHRVFRQIMGCGPQAYRRGMK